MRIHFYRLLAAAVLSAGASLPASAHHVMGGKMPATFMDGVLSGLGHPVIGIDHLAFLIAAGVAVGVARLSLAMPAVLVACSAIGVALHVNAVSVPGAELIVALSVILAGFLVASGRPFPLAAWAILFAAAGLFHGYAYGESIFGAERTPLLAYLIGLVAIQTALTVGVALLVQWRGMKIADLGARLTGATAGGVGLAVLAAQVIPSP
jgi:urease accessory protein